MPRTACTDFAGQRCPCSSPHIVDKRQVQPVGAIFQLALHQCLCSVVFRPQVQGNCHVASKLNCHLFNCCVDYALMFDTVYALISTITTAICSGCFVYSVMLLLWIMSWWKAKLSDVF